MFTCKNGPEHQHEHVSEARDCWKVKKTATPPPPAVTRPAVPYGEAPWYSPPPPATPRQLKFIEDLGGDMAYAGKLAKKDLKSYDASDYIKDLLDRKHSGKAASLPSTPAPPPESEPESDFITRAESTGGRKVDPREAMLTEMLKRVPEGYYATQVDEDNPAIDFVRISRPKPGKKTWGGATKIQTQHGPELKTAGAIWPSGAFSIYDSRLLDILMLLVVDWRSCAMRYSSKISKCCCCNTALTDERSRHYGIGPICDQKSEWAWVIAMVDEQNGGKSFEELQRSAY